MSTKSTKDEQRDSIAVQRLVGQLSEAWNHLSATLVGMPISDPRWKPAVDWLNANRCFQKPIPRLPNVQAVPAAAGGSESTQKPSPPLGTSE